jgi:hypothetical protein
MSQSTVAVMDVLVDVGFVCDGDVMLMGKMKVIHCSVSQRIVLLSQVQAVLNCCSDQTNTFLADAICSSRLL